MLDNQLIQIFRPIIVAGLAAYGILNTDVLQSNQPTTQGIPSNPTVFFYKLFDHRYGFPHREDVWDANDQIMQHTETQNYETTFQVNALVPQDPANLSGLTASDVVNSVAAILQSDATLSILQDNNIQILRIMDVRNPYFSDDKDRYEASPSFDFVITHEQTRIITVPVVTSFQYGIFPV